jgi:hypothetical protein
LDVAFGIDYGSCSAEFNRDKGGKVHPTPNSNPEVRAQLRTLIVLDIIIVIGSKRSQGACPESPRWSGALSALASSNPCRTSFFVFVLDWYHVKATVSMQSKMVNAQFPLGIEAHHCKLGAYDRYSLADHDEQSQGGSSGEGLARIWEVTLQNREKVIER